MQYEEQGINTTKLTELKTDVYNSAEEILKILKTIDRTLENSNEYLSDDLTETLKRKYEDLSVNYYKVYRNLVSISEEFDRVNYNYQEKDQELGQRLTNVGNENGNTTNKSVIESK